MRSQNNTLKVETKPDKISSELPEDSRINREGKNYSFGINAGRELGVSTLSYEVNYYHETNNATYLKIASFSDNSGLPLGLTGGTIIKLGTKRYTGNSFYYTVGLYHRQLDGRFYKRLQGGGSEKHESSFRDLGISTSIGNHWQWKNFSTSIDYIGLNRTILEIDKMTEPFERTSLNTLSLLNFGIGYTF